MTQEIITINLGAGQAEQPSEKREPVWRRWRLNGWTVAKYAALTVAGALLFRAGAAYAFGCRGYAAVGGEIFALFLPIIYYAVSTTVRDVIEDLKNDFKPNFKEDEEQ